VAKPVRVLQVLGGSPFGGGAAVVFSLIDMAREHGLSVTLESEDAETIQMARARGVEVLPFAGICDRLSLVRGLAAAVRLTKLLRGRFDLVHTHMAMPGAVARLAAHWAGTPLVVHTVHGWGAYDFAGPLLCWMGRTTERTMARWSDRIVFVNDYDRVQAVASGITTAAQSVTIHNGVPVERLTPGRGVDRAALLGELGLTDDCFLCVFAGKFVRYKGLPYLLQATAAIKARADSRPVHLAMLADGAERTAFEREVARLGLADRVHLLGYRRDAIRWIGGCDLFVQSSLWEGHSIALLEAMGLGRAIVATDIPSTVESLTHGRDGVVVPRADAAALAEAILAAAANRQEMHRLGGAAAATFQARFTERPMKQAYWEVYRELLAAKGLA
jgi:glycosyltransferase involved in cell wall biosynthesis